MIQCDYCSYIKTGGFFSFSCLEVHILSYKFKTTLASHLFCRPRNFVVRSTIFLAGAREEFQVEGEELQERQL